MPKQVKGEIEKRVVSPDKVLEKITPGMNIFIGTGVAEPRTLVKRLMNQDAGNLQDLELSQLVSLGDFFKHGFVILLLSFAVLWFWTILGYWTWFGF